MANSVMTGGVPRTSLYVALDAAPMTLNRYPINLALAVFALRLKMDAGETSVVRLDRYAEQ
jgi:hypothetical protein